MRAAPHSGFSALLSRLNPRTSAAIFGRPPSERHFPTPVQAKAGPVPSHEGLGPDDRDDLQDRWKPSIQLDQEQAIAVGELDATAHPPRAAGARLVLALYLFGPCLSESHQTADAGGERQHR